MYKDEMRMKHSVLGLDKINYAVRHQHKSFSLPDANLLYVILVWYQDESKLILNRLADQFGITA